MVTSQRNNINKNKKFIWLSFTSIIVVLIGVIIITSYKFILLTVTNSNKNWVHPLADYFSAICKIFEHDEQNIQLLYVFVNKSDVASKQLDKHSTLLNRIRIIYGSLYAFTIVMIIFVVIEKNTKTIQRKCTITIACGYVLFMFTGTFFEIKTYVNISVVSESLPSIVRAPWIASMQFIVQNKTNEVLTERLKCTIEYDMRANNDDDVNTKYGACTALFADPPISTNTIDHLITVTTVPFVISLLLVLVYGTIVICNKCIQLTDNVDENRNANLLLVGNSTDVQKLTDEERCATDKQVLITAESSRDPENAISRLFRIHVNDLDDNAPDFGQDVEVGYWRISRLNELLSQDESSNTFTYDDQLEWTSNSSAIIGQVYAFDRDLPPFNDINYYLLPSCSNRDGNFTIDQKTGEIRLTEHLSPPNLHPSYHLCVLASAFDTSSASHEIAFDRKNRSMSMITIVVKSLMAMMKLRHRPYIQFANNSATTIGDTMSNNIIPINYRSRSGSKLNYVLKNVEFKQSEMSPSTNTVNHSTSIFSIDQRSGDIRIGAKIFEQNEGIFILNVEAQEIDSGVPYANLISYVHHINSSSKLKYVFAEPLDTLGIVLDEFTVKVQKSIENSLQKSFRLVFDAPQQYGGKQDNRSSVCFHASTDNILLNKENVIATLSQLSVNDSALARIYQVYGVINIEHCEFELKSSENSLIISARFVWFMVIFVLVALIFGALISYLCFLIRYQEYIANEKCSEGYNMTAPMSAMKQPQFAITDGRNVPRFMTTKSPMYAIGW